MISNNRVVRVGAHFPWGMDLKEVAAFSKAAETTGLDSIWLVDKHTNWGELWATSVVVARSTERITLGIDATDPYRRNIVVTAHATATLDEISGGRVIFGIGRGTISLLREMGIEQRSPLLALRESIEVIRRLLDGEEVTLHGEVIHVDGARLSIRPVQRRIPIYQTGETPEDMRLASEISDGLEMWSGSATYLKGVREAIRAGVDRRFASPRDFALLPWVPFSVDDDRAAAKERLRARMTEVMRRVPDETLRLMGIDPTAVYPLRAAWEQGDIARAQSLLTDEILEPAAVYGAPAYCTERLLELVDLGVTEVMLQFTRNWVDDMAVLRDKILPALSK
ncbi:MAG: LLM class flavin-dependent oxidoreductase [Anaerolineales bacterium]|nr:LLM class flavin-dependent oxidoreductase [Anaerolineales bacterium]